MKKGLALLLGLMLVFTAGTALAGKDHIKVAMSDVPVGVDFYATSSRAALYYAYQIFDPLLERDPKTGELTPHLVTSWKTVDNNTWEFKLKPGVKFHNGEPFNAESVRFTIQDIIQNPEVKSPQAGAWKWCTKIEIIDDLTFRIITEKPYPLVVQRFNVLFPQDPKWTKEMIAQHGRAYLSRHAMGTGPFKLVKFVEGQRMEMAKNENYHKPGVPAFGQMTIRFIPEMSTRVAELLAGGVDAINYVGTDMVEMVKKKDNLRVIEVPILRIFFWQFDNMLRSPKSPKAMSDPRVRKAISYAIDRKAIVEHVLNGHATYINVPINPLSFGADPAITVPEYNPEKAKQLMKEAGYEDGFECSAWVVGGEYNKATEATMGYLSKINVKLKIREYIGRYGEFAKIWKAGKADGITTMGWGSYNIFDAGSAWPFFFMSPEGPFNYTNDQELSDLLRAGQETLDQNKRREIYKKAQKIIVDKAYWLPFYARHDISASDKRFQYTVGADQVPRWQYGKWVE